jgi:rare lipoprotein A
MRLRPRVAFRLIAPIGVCAAIGLSLANCSSSVDPRYGVSASPRVVEDGQPVPRGGGVYRVGTPYVVAGRTYVPTEDPNYRAEGLASWYGDEFHGRMTANGEVFDLNAISAAHPTLPLPSYVRVTNLSNGRSIIVRINDRGPFHGNRIIDVSGRTAYLLGFRAAGTAWVRVEYVGRAPIEGSDDRVLEATLREDEPAPAPNTVKLAATPIVPVTHTPVPARNTRLASAVQNDVSPVPVGAIAQPVAHTTQPSAFSGPDQLLNGRGLY